MIRHGSIRLSRYQSSRQRLGVVSNGLVELPKLELLLAALGDLADDPGRLAGDDAEAGDDHVGRDHGAVEDAHVVLYDGELADDGVVSYVYVGADAGRLDDRVLPDEDVVAHAEGHVGEDAAVRGSLVSLGRSTGLW